MDPAQLEARDHAAHQGDRAGALYGQLADMDPILDDRRPPRPRGDRGRLPGARRRVQGPPRRQHRRSRLLQLLPGQEPRRLRRGRHGRHQRRRARQARSACCATGARRSSYHHVLRASTTAWTASRARSCASSCATSKSWTEARRAHARAVRRAARGRAASRLRPRSPTARHVYHIYAVRTRRPRRRCSGLLAGAGHPDRAALPDPGPPAAGHADLGYQRGRLPAVRGGGATKCCRCRCSRS